MTTFGHSRLSRVVNQALIGMIGQGRGPGFISLLTVSGRRTGRDFTTPVVPLVTDQGRWLVSPYGEVGWVRNARASGQVTLSRGDSVEVLRAFEVAPADAIPILRAYRSKKPVGWIVRAHVAFGPRSSEADIAAQAFQYPVFKLSPGQRQDACQPER